MRRSPGPRGVGAPLDGVCHHRPHGAWPHARELGGHVVWAHPTGMLFVVNADGLSVPAAFLQERAGELVGPGVVLPLAALFVQSRPMTRTGVAS